MIFQFIFLALGLLVCILMLLTRLLTSKKELKENLSFECGFESYKISRLPFSLNFFMLSIIFVLFDLEIVILVTMVSSPLTLQLNSLVLGNLFLMFMLLSLLAEWSLNKLNWIF
uniref:NADH-ubiquinone oxidoreductase chain 3 n=1 Tax=Trichuris suis TaxID=68888 RepID=A0A0M3ULZ9_9BILA|nr:NADH dehydrogenase subunit 3 [Trichuris suis]